MRQVLLPIPIPFTHWTLPVPGYGVMLLCAFVACLWLAKRLGRRVGIEPIIFSDLAYWLFITGILGARVTFIIQYWDQFARYSNDWRSLLYHLFAVWDGGLVFYGSAFGGLFGYFVVERQYMKLYPFDRWKMIDVIAPCVALGLCLGRLGCFLNGCCYGNLACPECVAVQFPLASASRVPMVDRGVQTTAGFTVDRKDQRIVDWIEPGSHAEQAGLKRGDEIIGVNKIDIRLEQLLNQAAAFGSAGASRELRLDVLRDGRLVKLAPFVIVSPESGLSMGFTVDANRMRDIGAVWSGSSAEQAGLKKGDEIVAVNGEELAAANRADLTFHEAFRGNWPRGKNDLSLTVLRDGREIEIGPFTHPGVRLHPTQIYESISMILLVFLLVSLFPYNRYDGLLMVIFMVGYAVHRFLNEMLRNDTDPVAFGMTLSQNVSILVLIGAAVLGVFVWRHHLAKPSPVPPAASPS